MLIGLAPAAHGGNRTGRIFTGDSSGNWLYETLYKFGFANQPTSVRPNDGLALTDVYVTAAVRCAPPANKPLREELLACRPYLLDELDLLKSVYIVVAFGKIAFRCLPRRLSSTGICCSGPPNSPASVRTLRDPSVARWNQPGGLIPPQPAEHPDRTSHQRDVRGSLCHRQAHDKGITVASGTRPDLKDNRATCGLALSDW